VSDLTPEGLRVRLDDAIASCNAQHDTGDMDEYQICSECILAAFTVLVAEARTDERAGLLRAFHVTLDALGAPPDDWPCNRAKYLVVEARRAQREADALAVCWFCRAARPFVDGRNTRHVGQNAQGDLIEIHCVAAAIRAQGETL